MKTEIFNMNNNGDINEFEFHIGKNKSENFDVIDLGMENDFWFHAEDTPSCHVVVNLNEIKLSKKEKNLIIKKGALLCKENTNSLINKKNVGIIYTKIKNIEKTNRIGTVLTKETKVIYI